MSVLIKDMKMPESCSRCLLMVGTFCDVLEIDVDPFYDGANKRHASCPLVGLPEKHGRLIDERVAYDKIAEQEGGYYMDMDGVDCGLGETPTVIEAEGEDE